MALDQAVAYASQMGSEHAQSEGHGGLTAREREVAALVGLLATNREIAARLVISERTAKRHVENILSKLGFRSRVQIGDWAQRHGLPPTA